MDVSKLFSEDIPPNDEIKDHYRVLLNGTIVGVVKRGENPNKFVERIKSLRGTRLPAGIGVSVDHAVRIININTDSGRFLIPLIPAKYILEDKATLNAVLADVSRALDGPDGHKAWDMLLAKGIVELHDQVMVDNVVVAQSIEDLIARKDECTHVQLPCAHVGMIMALSCSADRNKGVRNLYSCNQWKQGIGDTIHNPHTFYLTEMNILRGAQRPLVRSAFNGIMGLDRYPFSVNAHVAYLAYADNQADALIFNQAAVDRGLFVVHHYEEKVVIPDTPNAAFGVPDFEKVYAPAASANAYLKVDRVLGTPTTIGQEFIRGDVIAAITKPLTPGDIETLKKKSGLANKEVSFTLADVSIINKSDHGPNERHPAPQVLTASSSSVDKNERIRMMQFASTRFVKPGDKFANEHAQKGICGKNMEEWMLPYTDDGLRPEMIFTPQAPTRRETHWLLPASVLGKICAEFGTAMDSTPFLNKIEVEKVSKLLSELGMNENGTERMYDPLTGIAFVNPVMFGLVSYTRQRRMIDDLAHCRYHGPREAFSRMPTKGRDREGGVMIDEMTRNAMIASGASLTVRDSMFTQAAPHRWHICDKCHQPAYPDQRTPGVIRCDRCGNLDPAISHEVITPYNALLIYSILAGAGCNLEIQTESACTLAGRIPEDSSK